MSKKAAERSRAGSQQSSKRKAEQDRMLQEALEQPGIPDVMRVYGNRRPADEAMRAYRRATRQTVVITNTDRSNI